VAKRSGNAESRTAVPLGTEEVTATLQETGRTGDLSLFRHEKIWEASVSCKRSSDRREKRGLKEMVSMQLELLSYPEDGSSQTIRRHIVKKPSKSHYQCRIACSVWVATASSGEARSVSRPMS
jgi:hypothetical protein